MKIQPLEAELALVKAELEEVRANQNRGMEELKKQHEAERTKLIHDHEAELEEQAKQVQEARQFALSEKRSHQFAKREYTRAKISCAVQAERMKEMELNERHCIKLLRSMDKRLSGKLFNLLRLIGRTSGFFLILTKASFDVSLQMLSRPRMRAQPMLSKSFGRREPRGPKRRMKRSILAGGSRTGYTRCAAAWR